MKSGWLTHKDARILYLDISNFGSDFESVKAEIGMVHGTIIKQPSNSVSELINVQHTVISKKIAELFKNNAETSKKHLRKVAVIGATKLTNIIVQAIIYFSGLNIRTFDDIEKAKDWLVDLTV
jgi:hypothetical protein